MTESTSQPRADLAPETAAWRELALKVLEAATTHAVHCGTAQVEDFRKVVKETMAGLEDSASSSQALIAAGVLSQAIAHYCGQTQREVDAMHVELNDTLQVFLEHLEQLHPEPTSQGLVADLRNLVEDAMNGGRLGAAHEEVSAKLRELAEQAATKRKRSLELAENLKDRVTILQQPAGAGLPASVPVSAAVDLVTGLPNKPEAEAAVQRALESAANAYVAVFYLHRMPLTNARFGEAIGNQVILFCSQHIATMVTRGNDQLFRWSGPAFVAVLERQESALNVSSEVQRMVSAPLSRFFETSSRSVYLPIKMTATVLPLADTNFAEVSGAIEHYVLQASGGSSEN